MQHLAVGIAVVDEQHLVLGAAEVGDHTVEQGPLLDFPVHHPGALVAVEFRAAEGPELGEVELVALALKPDCGEELARQGELPYLRPPAADVEGGVVELAPRDCADQVARR